jgi:Flp pilus assembly protein TadB
VSKERARRRAERERVAAIKAAARAAEAERRDRRQVRRQALRRATDRLHLRGPARPTGVLARRRRIQTSLLFALLVALNVLVWVARPDWRARLAALIVTVLAAPVLATVLIPPRR